MTLNILGVHYRDTKNIGDRYCHPLDYMDFNKSMDDVTYKCDVRTLPTEFKPDIVIIGGGAIARHCLEMKKLYPDAKHVAWGIGVTRGDHKIVNSATHEKFSDGYDLYGCRDYRAKQDYVPCASCLHPIFNKDFDIVNKVAVYGHAGKMPLRKEASMLSLPYMENNDKSGFSGAIDFIGSCDTLITSSYHGAYWGAIMGKKVAVIPFGSKFYSLRNLPAFVTSVEQGIEEAIRFPSALIEAQGITNNFATKVSSLIDSIRKN